MAAAKKSRHNNKTKNKTKTTTTTTTNLNSNSQTINEIENDNNFNNDNLNNSQLSLSSINEQFKEMYTQIAKSIKLIMLEYEIEFKGGDYVILEIARNISSNLNDYPKFTSNLNNLTNGKISLNDFFQYLNTVTPEKIKGRELNLIIEKEIEEIDNDNNENNDNYDNGYNSDDSGEEYSFDLELSNNFFDPYKFHIAIFKLLRITIPSKKIENSSNNKRIEKLFLSLATLCDPYTQPSSTGENNEMILSADLISDLIISLHYSDYIDINNKGNIFNLPKFDFAFDLAQIIEKIMIILNSDNETNLMNINNDELNWENELSKWLPHNSFSNIVNIASDFHHLMLLYTILTVSLLIISKLYNDIGNICLNPFLSLFLQLWKNLTKIIYLGIEIDRRDEDNGFPGYPEVIRYMIKGSSAARSMISLILNDDFSKRFHDLKHESLINFMRPWGRKFTNGSITRDIRVFVAALLALGSELDSVTELLFNFDPEDRYDEDIRYMFDMELEDIENSSNNNKRDNNPNEEYNNNNNKEDEEEDEEDEYHNVHKESNIKRKLINGNQFIEIESHSDEFDTDNLNSNNTIYDLHPDCKCEFEDFESDYEYDENEDEDFDNEDEIVDNETNIERIKEIKQLDNEKFINDIEKLSHLSNIDLKDLDIETIQKLHLEAVHSINSAPLAIRTISNKKLEIDSKGRDWRDIPRGDNQILTKEFIKLLQDSISDSTIFLTPIENLLNSMKLMIKETLDSKTCEKIIRSVAWVVQYEHESKLMTDEEAKLNNDPNVNADVIYNFLKSDDNFVKMMSFNPSSSFFIIDELLMAEGYRRVLIWFLTHLPLNQWLINYFHDLLIGERGNPKSDDNATTSTRFTFSRKGALILSDVEKSMLLHEFLSNAVIYLSRGSSFELEDILENNNNNENNSNKIKIIEENSSSFITNRSNAQKLIKVICLMLKSLESHEVINPKDSEYRVEIQTLLVQWVGVGFVPEARELFFKYSNNNDNNSNNDENVNEEIRVDDEKNSTDGNPIIENKKQKSDGLNEILSIEDKNLILDIVKNGPISSTSDKSERREYLSLLLKLHQSKLYKLTSNLENFSSFDLFILTLNMAHHYTTEKDTCFEFIKGLNMIYHVYDKEKELMEAFDDFYSPLNNAIINGDDEKVIEIMHASKFLSNDTIIQARRAMRDFVTENEEEVEAKDGNINKDKTPNGHMESNNNDGRITMKTLKLLKEFPLEECIDLGKHKNLLKVQPSDEKDSGDSKESHEGKSKSTSSSSHHSKKNKKKSKHGKRK